MCHKRHTKCVWKRWEISSAVWRHTSLHAYWMSGAVVQQQGWGKGAWEHGTNGDTLRQATFFRLANRKKKTHPHDNSSTMREAMVMKSKAPLPEVGLMAGIGGRPSPAWKNKELRPFSTTAVVLHWNRFADQSETVGTFPLADNILRSRQNKTRV